MLKQQLSPIEAKPKKKTLRSMAHGIMLAIVGLTSLLLVSNSFSNTGFYPQSIDQTNTHSYHLTQIQEKNPIAMIITKQNSSNTGQESPNAIPSPAPLSIVALLLLILATAIRRHQQRP
ncbi:MAG: hypothetical protein COA99_18545 [Moraxellaceae bacterium]|nr:MAG: hypothetical protein COA99_18545 [Moraxellaceae bacterium]